MNKTTEFIMMILGVTVSVVMLGYLIVSITGSSTHDIYTVNRLGEEIYLCESRSPVTSQYTNKVDCLDGQTYIFYGTQLVSK